MRKTILEKLEKKGGVPPFPDLLINLQNKIDKAYVNIDEISKLIEIDMVLTGNILKLSNSAYYKTGYQATSTLDEAINKLGLTVIKHLAYSLKLVNSFGSNSIINSYQFWCHSIGVGIISERLSEICQGSEKERDTAYISGLMHDAGIMVFSFIIPEQYLEFLKKASVKSVPIEKQEKIEFGIDHQELGALLINKYWHMDNRIADAVGKHHAVDKEVDGETKSAAHLVSIADRICNDQGFGNGIKSFYEGVDDYGIQELGLSSTAVQDLVDNVDTVIGQAVEMVSCV